MTKAYLKSGSVVIIQQVGRNHDAFLGNLLWSSPDSIPGCPHIVCLQSTSAQVHAPNTTEASDGCTTAVA